MLEYSNAYMYTLYMFTNTEETRLSVRVPAELRKRLRQHAIATDESVQSIIIRLIQAELAKVNERK